MGFLRKFFGRITDPLRKPKPLVFGVVHTTLFRRPALTPFSSKIPSSAWVGVKGTHRRARAEKWMPTPMVSKAMAELEKAKVARIGIEARVRNEDELDRERPPDRYRKALEMRLKKRGIEAVDLEDDFVSRSICRFSNLISRTAVNALATPSSMLHMLASPEEEPLFETLHAMAIEVEKKFPEPGKKELEKIDDALNVFRSIKMYDKAVARRLPHILVGRQHAEELQILRGAPTVFIAEGLAQSGEARQRIRDYKELRRLIRKLEKIARRHAEALGEKT